MTTRTSIPPSSGSGSMPAPSSSSITTTSTTSSSTPNPGVLAFFIMYCEGKTRAARSLFQEEFIKPAPGSRQISLEDYQNVVRDLVVNQELFDSMMKSGERPVGQFGPMLPPGRSFKCLRGATFALHQFSSGGTNIRFFLVTDPSYSSIEAQRKLGAIYSGPFVDLVVRSESISLRDLLNEAPRVLTAAMELKNNNAQQQQQHQVKDEDTLLKNIVHCSDQPPKLIPVLPKHIQVALKSEVLAILRGV